ncbi:hypothetical protein DAI22_01g098200 [Oryza sativa Japonica Group]|nr:hypothetical protein DAI22_01g098200 [Oryza sativa Japonica Group]
MGARMQLFELFNQRAITDRLIYSGTPACVLGSEHACMHTCMNAANRCTSIVIQQGMLFMCRRLVGLVHNNVKM